MSIEALLKKKNIYIIMLLVAIWVGCSPSPSFALPVGSYGQAGDHLEVREKVDAFLAGELVSRKLASMGLSEAEISSRLDSLSDGQIRTLAMNLERIKAGSSGAAVAIVVVLLLIGMVLFFLTHDVQVTPKETLE